MMSGDLAKYLASIRLRVRYPCNSTEKSSRARVTAGILAELGNNALDCVEFAAPPQKVSVVPVLPIPAGGFCRRSAAVQWALVQEMSRHAEEYNFDFGEEEWPVLSSSLHALDDEDFDFEFIDCEDEEDDFVLEMLADDDGDDNLDGEWAKILISATAEANAEGSANTVAGIAAAATALELDFRKAVRCFQRVPVMPRACAPDCADATAVVIAKTEEPEEMWPTLAGGSVVHLSTSPNSVADIAGQWVSVVERSKEPRLPAEDKKSRNFRDMCRRTAHSIRRAEKKMILKAQQPEEEFPALPGLLEL